MEQQNGDDMKVHRPTWKNEWNVNTLVTLVLFFMTIGGALVGYGRFTSRVDVIEKDLAVNFERFDERLKRAEQQERDVDNLKYRMAVQEQGTTSLVAAVAELRQTINDVTGDIRLIREIVTRIEAKPGN